MILIDIIGGSGFIGTSIVSKIINNKDYSISIIDKNISANYPHLSVICDIRNIDELQNKLRENAIVIHLAAEHSDNISRINDYYEVNVSGTKNICNVAKTKNISQIIFTSSVAVYGNNNSKTACNESSETKPTNHYGKSKLQAEKCLEEWLVQNKKYKLSIIRPTVVFGINNRGNLYNLLHQIYTRKFVMIGDGNNIKSIAYVENISLFIISLINSKERFKILNYVDKPDLTMNELIKKSMQIMGREPKIKYRIPLFLGIIVGWIYDLAGFILKRKFSISAIRIKKFTSNSIFSTVYPSEKKEFTLDQALAKTIKNEFLER